MGILSMTYLDLGDEGYFDRLTGLHSPEIFYDFLKKAIAEETRRPEQQVALIRFRLRLKADPYVEQAPTNQKGQGGAKEGEELRGTYRGSADDVANDVASSLVAYDVAKLAKRLTTLTRSSETLVRIGQRTFLLLAKVAGEDELSDLEQRFAMALSQVSVDEEEEPSTVDIDGFVHREGEELLDFLERVGV